MPTTKGQAPTTFIQGCVENAILNQLMEDRGLDESSLTFYDYDTAERYARRITADTVWLLSNQPPEQPEKPAKHSIPYAQKLSNNDRRQRRIGWAITTAMAVATALILAL